MAKISLTRLPGQVGGLMSFWKSVHTFNVEEIAREAERPFKVTLVGTPEYTSLLTARLALEVATPRDSPTGPPDVRPYIESVLHRREASPNSIILEADQTTRDETKLSEELAKIVVAHPDLRLSLARHIPAFRPSVATALINESSWGNAKIALVSALPGVLPFGDVLLPATALGDMLLLTRNQALLLLKISAAYGLAVDLKARSKELLPIVGSAFGWRAVARELVGIVPGGLGVVVKASIAYAGTYTVGRAAAIYYSTGTTLSQPRLKELYNDALKSARTKVGQLIKRPGKKTDLALADNQTAMVLASETQKYSHTEDFLPNTDNLNHNLDIPVKIGV